MSFWKNLGAGFVKGFAAGTPDALDRVHQGREQGAQRLQQEFNAAPDYDTKMQVAGRAKQGNFLSRQTGLGNTMESMANAQRKGATTQASTMAKGFSDRIGGLGQDISTPDQARSSITDLESMQKEVDLADQELSAKGVKDPEIQRIRTNLTSEITRLRGQQKLLEDKDEQDKTLKQVGMEALRSLTGSGVTSKAPYMTALNILGLDDSQAQQVSMSMISLASQVAAKAASTQSSLEDKAIMKEISDLVRTKDPASLDVARQIATQAGHGDIAESITKMIPTLKPSPKRANEAHAKMWHKLMDDWSNGYILGNDGVSKASRDELEALATEKWSILSQLYPDAWMVSEYGPIDDAVSAYNYQVSRGANPEIMFNKMTANVPASIVDEFRERIGPQVAPRKQSSNFMFDTFDPQAKQNSIFSPTGR